MAKYSVSYVYELVDKYSRTAVKIGNTTDRMKKSFDKTSRSVGKLGKNMVKVGAAMTAVATVPILLLGRNMINAASDAEETRSKFAFIFKDIEKRAFEASDSFAKSFGLAGSTAQEMLSYSADILTGIGFTSDAALKLSVSLGSASQDLVSFKNFSGGASQANVVLTKALLGQRDALESLGIKILEVDVKRKLSQMKREGYRFATQNEAKAQATLNLIMERSKNAIGDYERTKASFANMQRKVTENNKTLSESFGKLLIPQATKALTVIDRLQSSFIGTSEESKKLIVAISLIVAVVGPMILALGALGMAAPFIVAGFWLVVSPITAIIVLVGILIASFAFLLAKSDSVWQAMSAAAMGLGNLLLDIFTGIGAVLMDAVLAPFKVILRIIDMLPMVKVPDSLKDFAATSKAAMAFSKYRQEASENLLAGGMGGNPAAQGAANQNTLNGNIDVTASGGASVNSAVFRSGSPANIGTTVANRGVSVPVAYD
tara:strand:- start:626 stop:2092 length:1467 start_codon:yes stop_codon:yes gene_type:complete